MTDVITVPVVPRVHVQGGGEFPVHRIEETGELTTGSITLDVDGAARHRRPA